MLGPMDAGEERLIDFEEFVQLVQVGWGGGRGGIVGVCMLHGGRGGIVSVLSCACA